MQKSGISVNRSQKSKSIMIAGTNPSKGNEPSKMIKQFDHTKASENYQQLKKMFKKDSHFERQQFYDQNYECLANILQTLQKTYCQKTNQYNHLQTKLNKLNNKNQQLKGQNQLIEEEIQRKQKFNAKLKYTVNFIREEETIMKEKNNKEKQNLHTKKSQLKKSIIKGMKQRSNNQEDQSLDMFDIFGQQLISKNFGGYGGKTQPSVLDGFSQIKVQPHHKQNKFQQYIQLLEELPDSIQQSKNKVNIKRTDSRLQEDSQDEESNFDLILPEESSLNHPNSKEKQEEDKKQEKSVTFFDYLKKFEKKSLQ